MGGGGVGCVAFYIIISVGDWSESNHPATVGSTSRTFMRRIAIMTNRVLCYGPTRLFKPPGALAMHKFGQRQSRATMHQWFGEGSATYASNRHASPRHRDIEKKFIACIEIFSRCFDAKYHQRYITEQRRAVGEHSAMYTKAKNVPATSATHRRHIGGDTSGTHRWQISDARVNIGDAYSMW